MIEDKLTGLQDRASFMTRLKMHCERAITMGHKLGLLVIDLDRFHRINEWFGFGVGDEALRNAAQILTGIARKKDLVARLGSNQFAIAIPGVMNEGHAVLAAAKLARVLEQPLELMGREVTLSASTGIALSPQHSSNFDRLFASAERAMRDARGRGVTYAISNNAEDQENDDALQLEFELESAFASGDLEMYFQPRISLTSRLPVGAEALMRWNSGIRGYVEPEEFVAAGERARLINTMTQWAVNSALQSSIQWPDRFGQQSVAVNLSAAVLADPNLADNIENCLGLWEVPRCSLTLEVTESTALAAPEETFRVFEQLNDIDVKISLDDFGTGYSSLAHFRHIPASEVKLDKSFVQKIVEDSADRKIAGLVIDLAHAFDMSVVAEGVETQETLNLLGDMGCDVAQGFHIARPMCHADYVNWLSDFPH